jgi:hypothetical protein
MIRDLLILILGTVSMTGLNILVHTWHDEDTSTLAARIARFVKHD